MGVGRRCRLWNRNGNCRTLALGGVSVSLYGDCVAACTGPGSRSTCLHAWCLARAASVLGLKALLCCAALRREPPPVGQAHRRARLLGPGLPQPPHPLQAGEPYSASIIYQQGCSWDVMHNPGRWHQAHSHCACLQRAPTACAECRHARCAVCRSQSRTCRRCTTCQRYTTSLCKRGSG